MSTEFAQPKKDQRFEFRRSTADRELFGSATGALGPPVSTFANDQLRVAA